MLSEHPSNSKLKGKMNSGGVLFGITIGVSLNLELGVAIMAERNPEKTLLEHPSKSKLYGERNSVVWCAHWCAMKLGLYFLLN